MLTRIIDVLPQATVPIILTLSLLAAFLMAWIVAALARDAADTREAVELARLTASLPRVPVSHRHGSAPGTAAQRARWNADTGSFSVAELYGALRVGVAA